MNDSYRRGLVATEPAEIKFEIDRIRRMMRSCQWKAARCVPLYARLAKIAPRRRQISIDETIVRRLVRGE